MILYRVYSGIVTVKSVVRETKCGWRESNGGFINHSVLGVYPRPSSLSSAYYTTDKDEAVKWCNSLISTMNELKDIAYASLSDLDSWVDDGQSEDHLPDTRIY